MSNEKKLKTVLYNAISLLIDETFEQYDDTEEWLTMVYNELDCTKEELASFGIVITVDGGLYKVEDMEVTKELIEAMVNYAQCASWTDNDVIEALIDCGITEEDFKHCGYGDFVKEYFNDDSEE